jgi:hypothetical protein
LSDLATYEDVMIETFEDVIYIKWEEKGEEEEVFTPAMPPSRLPLCFTLVNNEVIALAMDTRSDLQVPATYHGPMDPGLVPEEEMFFYTGLPLALHTTKPAEHKGCSVLPPFKQLAVM